MTNSHPLLSQYSVQFLEDESSIDPFKTYSQNDDTIGTQVNVTDEPSEKKNVKIVFPEEHLKTFVEIIQYTLKSIVKIIDEAKEMKEFKNIPKIQIENKLKEIAVKEKPQEGYKLCWCVKDDVYKNLNMIKPDIPEILKIASRSGGKPSPQKKITITSIYNDSNKQTNKDSLHNTHTKKEPLLNFLPIKRKKEDEKNKKPKKIVIDLVNE